MISTDIKMTGFDARAFENLVSLFVPKMRARAVRTPLPEDFDPNSSQEISPSGVILVARDREGNIRKAHHTRRGWIRNVQSEDLEDLREFAHVYGADRVWLFEDGALAELNERFASRIQKGDDYLAQILILLRTLKEALEDDLIQTWPRLFVHTPIPTPAMLRRAFDTFLPDETCFALVVFEGSMLYTSLVIRRRRGEIDLIAGPDALRRWTGPLGGDYSRDHRIILDALGEHVSPVHMGIFVEKETVLRLLRSDEPGAWAKAIALREVLIKPAPAYVHVAASADAVRAVARRTVKWFAGYSAVSSLGLPFTALREHLPFVSSVRQALGFDPLATLADWLRRSDASIDRELRNSPKPESPDPTNSTSSTLLTNEFDANGFEGSRGATESMEVESLRATHGVQGGVWDLPAANEDANDNANDNASKEGDHTGDPDIDTGRGPDA